jgi:hypothetical protein
MEMESICHSVSKSQDIPTPASDHKSTDTLMQADALRYVLDSEDGLAHYTVTIESSFVREIYTDDNAVLLTNSQPDDPTGMDPNGRVVSDNMLL